MFLDFSNAFSTMSRQGLLDTFAGTNPPYLLTKWIHNYIIGHRQFMRANNKVSSVLWWSPWYCSFTILFTFYVAIGHLYRDSHGIFTINKALNYFSQLFGGMVEEIVRKCVCLSLIVKKLLRLLTPAESHKSRLCPSHQAVL